MRIFFSFFGSFIKKIKRSRLRRMMRGYRQLKQSGQIDLISKVKQSLSEQQLNLTNKDFSVFLMGAGYFYGEIVVRQYLLFRIGGLNLNQALLYASGKRGAKVIYPLPKLWRATIGKHGFKVANLRSSLLWQLYIIGAFLYGVFQIFKVIFSGLASLSSKVSNTKKYVYFVNLSSGNLPQNDRGEKSYDVISWYLQWNGRNQNIEAIHHSVPNIVNKTIGGTELKTQTKLIPSLKGMCPIVKFTIWGLSACFLAFIEGLRGNWWHAFLLNQTALSAQLRSLPKPRLACEYLFHNSDWIYRPLWTYDAEQVGSKVSFYFYSTNVESIKISNSNSSIPYGWKAMSWPHYLVWDDRQADLVRMSVGNGCKISIVGSIWFQSSAGEMPKINKPSIAVFDVTPFRLSRYILLGNDSEFYIPTITNSFLYDLRNKIIQHQFIMLWKRKRNIGRMAHPSYRQFVDGLTDSNYLKSIEPSISAIRIIETSIAVISMPFTSTALIAREMGKPSVYYDPTGLLQKNDPAAHGIPLLSNTAELETWFSEEILERCPVN
jgi:polysaccharide biosynthesis PFTS motif protein